MKLKAYLGYMFIWAAGPLSAASYEVWETKEKWVEIDCIPAVVNLNDYRLEPIMSEDEDDARSQSGTIDFLIKKKKILNDILIKDNIGELYQKIKEEQADMNEAFLAHGTTYILIDRDSQTYYYCFIEWDIRSRLRQPYGIPRISLAPLQIIDENTFMLKDYPLIISSSPISVLLIKKLNPPKEGQ